MQDFRYKSVTLLILLTAALLEFFGCSAGGSLRRRSQLRKINSWVCVYSKDASPTDIRKFDLAILDADMHPELMTLKGNTLMMGYVSLAEVTDNRWFWPEISAKSWVLDKNTSWNSWFVDVRSPEWHEMVLNRIIPAILEQGFDGLFLDTVDNAEYLERYHPAKNYPGSEEAMVQLIKKIRKKYPDIYIIANRGYAILDRIGGVLDALVAESTFAIWDTEAKRSRILNSVEFEITVKNLKATQARFKLPILSLDYVEYANPVAIERILSRSRECGFIPYISTPDLFKIYFHTFEL
jgi:uncharacterized protein (TIGR01370 family)